MLEMLDKGHHEVVLTEEEHARFAAWMDLLVPFSGDYREGNAWNDRQHAFYSYYEGKRALTSREEMADLLEYLKKPAGSVETEVPAFAKAEFREVLAGSTIGSDGKISPAPADGVFVIDRLVLAASANDPLAVTVRDARTNEVLARTTIPSGGSSPLLVLSKPVRSDSVRIGLEKSAPDAPGLRVVSAHGVALEEVPVIDGFHPFLDLAP
jgi:hypothetical protein